MLRKVGSGSDIEIMLKNVASMFGHWNDIETGYETKVGEVEGVIYDIMHQIQMAYLHCQLAIE